MYSHIFHSVSQPLFESGLSNPAFSSFSGTYEAHITANENFIFDYLSAGAQINRLGISFATYRYDRYSQSWAGIRYRFDFPLAIGMNLGTSQIYQDSDIITDFGLWFNYWLHFGISYRNILQDERLLRAGATFTRRKISMMCEIESGGDQQRTDINLGLGYLHHLGEIDINGVAGYNLHNFAFTLGFTYRQFKVGMLLSDVFSDTFRINMMVSIFLEPPVKEKIIVFQETLEVYVHKPTSLKKPITTKKPLTVDQLSTSERLYCEQHYLKGIEYYLANDLKKAIEEWNLVRAKCPEYKEVQRYLANATEKIKQLEEK